MKKLTTSIALLLAIYFCNAQQPVILNLNMQNKISGIITIPALQSLNVITQNSGALNFLNQDDFYNGKEITAFYKLNVNSNIPWIITAKTQTNDFNNLTVNGSNIPSVIMSIKNTTDNNYIPLSSTEKNIIISSNNKIVSDYQIDLKLNPSWNYGGGLYDINIVFTLTPQ